MNDQNEGAVWVVLGGDGFNGPALLAVCATRAVAVEMAEHFVRRWHPDPQVWKRAEEVYEETVTWRGPGRVYSVARKVPIASTRTLPASNT